MAIFFFVFALARNTNVFRCDVVGRAPKILPKNGLVLLVLVSHSLDGFGRCPDDRCQKCQNETENYEHLGRVYLDVILYIILVGSYLFF